MDSEKLGGTVCALIIGLVAMAMVAPCDASPLVQTHVTGGTVRGVLKEGVASFKGMPFAAPPVGELRWKPPQPQSPWKGIRNADTFAQPCAQGRGDGTAPSGEDCLYLNVWTAAESSRERRPVMVWIHGGGFQASTPSEPVFDGTRFAQQGVVLVSIAYRLGVFGFLAHPELDRESGKASGNYGLRDQIAALKWVKANIASFGGDPQGVTVFGESAGGTAVGLLAAAPAARGLFARAISESGTSFRMPAYSLPRNDWVGPLQSRQLAEDIGQEFLHQLGAPDIAAARALPAQIILRTRASAERLWFYPNIDGDVLPAPNEDLYRLGSFNDTPILIGTNSDEGHRDAGPTVTLAMLHSVARSFPCPQLAEGILSLYSFNGDADATRAVEVTRRDGGTAWDTWTWARWQSRKGRGKVFVYYFDVPIAKFPNGVPHWVEVPYVFGYYGWWDEQRMPLRPEDLATSDLVRRYWINFATTGDPNGESLPRWPAFTTDAPNAMVFDRTSSARPLPNLERLRAFDAWYTCLWQREAPGR